MKDPFIAPETLARYFPPVALNKAATTATTGELNLTGLSRKIEEYLKLDSMFLHMEKIFLKFKEIHLLSIYQHMFLLVPE